MRTPIGMRCDGCGQIASREHIDRRLRRLEWATRYRPVHIQTLLLGAIAPVEDADFLYSPGDEFHGEAALLINTARIDAEGKSAEAVRAEFQRTGYFLAYVLECPVETPAIDSASLLRERLPSLASRIRRSLKPKCVTLVTETLRPLEEDMFSLDLGCPVRWSKGTR
jgi:hypothetical protein